MSNLHPIMAMALRPFAPAPTNALTDIDSGEWFKFQFTSADSSVTYDCYMEYEAGEDGGRDHPSEPESLNLSYALVNGVDVSLDLSTAMLEAIHTAAWLALEKSRKEDEYDRGEYLDQQRKEARAERMAA